MYSESRSECREKEHKIFILVHSFSRATSSFLCKLANNLNHTSVQPIQSIHNLTPCKINKEIMQHPVAPLQMNTLFKCSLYSRLQLISEIQSTTTTIIEQNGLNQVTKNFLDSN